MTNRPLPRPHFAALVLAVGALGLAACDGNEPPAECEADCEPDPGAVEPDPAPTVEPDPEPAPEPDPVELPASDNGIDAVMGDAFQDIRHVPQMASDLELCRRLSADLMGVYLSVAEAEATCVGRDLGEVIEEMQASEAYRVHAQRRWADRFQTSDVLTDWRYLKDLYRIVDEMQLGTMRYDDFAIEVLAHPGFTMTVFQATPRAYKAYEVFLGRTATEAEAADFASLFRAWIPGQEMDPDIPYIYRNVATILPYLCAPVAACEATVLGGGVQEFPDLNGYQPIMWEARSDEVDAVLRVPGEMVARQPFFWEAAADEILDRLLDWDNGAREPRRPGYLFPEVRQAVAKLLEETGSYPAAERLVLESWLYRQTNNPDLTVEDAVVLEEGEAPPVFISGPVKAARSEVWLDSALKLSELDLGDCDPRYSDGFAYFMIYDALGQELITPEDAEAAFILLNDLREDRQPLLEQDGYIQPNYQYSFIARLIGGCPGFNSTRQDAAGLAYAFMQESLTELICTPEVANLSVPPGIITPSSALEHQMPLLLGREPVSEEVDAFEEIFDGCVDEECSSVGITSATCVALLGSAEFLFY